MAIHRMPLSFWMSAVQSAIFNRVLDERILAGTLDHLLEGDLAARPGSGSVFAVTAPELDDHALRERVRRIELSPSGPLWGSEMRRAGGLAGEIERRALEATGMSVEAFLGSPWVPAGGRRPLRTRLSNGEVDAGVDAHGHYVRVAFDLPPGMYGTVALREIMKNEEGDGEE
jgi:tRNA pseudouridine13 synthase